jgi:transcription antitermination factor NusA-like protein
MVDMGKATGILFRNEQVPGEHYYTGQRVKIYIVRVENSAKGPQNCHIQVSSEMIQVEGFLKWKSLKF